METGDSWRKNPLMQLANQCLRASSYQNKNHMSHQSIHLRILSSTFSYHIIFPSIIIRPCMAWCVFQWFVLLLLKNIIKIRRTKWQCLVFHPFESGSSDCTHSWIIQLSTLVVSMQFVKGSHTRPTRDLNPSMVKSFQKMGLILVASHHFFFCSPCSHHLNFLRCSEIASHFLFFEKLRLNILINNLKQGMALLVGPT